MSRPWPGSGEALDQAAAPGGPDAPVLAAFVLVLTGLLLTAAVAAKVAPGLAHVVAHAVNEAGSGGALTSVHWT